MSMVLKSSGLSCSARSLRHSINAHARNFTGAVASRSISNSCRCCQAGKGSSGWSWEQQVMADAKAGLKPTTQEGVLEKLTTEFAVERLSSYQRTEGVLSRALAELEELAQLADPPREVFNKKRSKALALRFELTVMREAAGMSTASAAIGGLSTEEKNHPIPPPL